MIYMTTIIKTNKYDSFFEKISHIAFFVYQLLLVISVSAFARVANNGEYYKYFSAFIMLSFAVIMFSAFYNFLRGRFSTLELIIYFIIGIICTISFFRYRVVMVLANIFAIAAFKYTNGKKVLKYYIYATAFGFLINVLLCILTKYTGNVVQYRYFGERVRYGLGFYYASLPSYYFLSIVSTYILLKSKLIFKEYLIILFLNILIFIFTDTKAPFIYTNILILYLIIINNIKSPKIIDVFGVLCVISFPFFVLFSYFTSYFYNENNPILFFFNKILTGRLSITHKAMELYGFNILGQTVDIVIPPETHVDSSFISMLMLNGLLVIIIAILFMTFFSFLAYKQRNRSLIVVLTFIAIRSSFDFGFMAMQFMPVIFLFYPTLREYLDDK